MNTRTLLSGVLLAAAMAGCGDGSSPPAVPPGGADRPAPVRSPAATMAATAAAARQYTILLYRYTGPDHVRTAQKGLNACQTLAGWKDVFVITESDASTLYRGRYDSLDAARKVLPAVQQWQTPAKLCPFQMAFARPMPGSDVGRPEWDLRNAHGAYTIVIEVYHDDPNLNLDRKAVAAARAAELRQQGEEAYYYHGPGNSLVTIGAFPKSAIQFTRQGTVDEPSVVDPQMQAVLAKHPLLYTNGRLSEVAVPNIQTRKGEMVPRPTYPARIPASDQAAEAPPQLRTGSGTYYHR